MKNIFKVFSIIFILSVSVKILDVFKNLFIASHLGVSSNSDVYLALISLPDSLIIFLGIDTIRGVTNSEYSSLRTAISQLSESFQNLVKLLFIVGMFILIPIMIFKQTILSILFVGFSQDKILLAANVASIILPIFVIKIFIGFLTTVNNSLQRFYYPVIISSILPIVVILFLYLGRKSEFILETISYGNLIGNLIYLFLLVVFTSLLFKSFKFSFPKFDRITKKILKGSLTTLILVIINQLYFFSKNYFISYFPDGSLSAVNYASSITGLIGNLLFLSIFTVILTNLSSLYEEKQFDEAGRLFWNLILYLSYVVIPIVLIFLLCDSEILSMVYNRGNFDLNAIEKVNGPFNWESLSIYTFVLYIIPTALYLAFKKYKALTFIGSCVYLFGILLNYFFSNWFGYTGVPIAGFLISLIYGFLLIYFARKFWSNHWKRIKELAFLIASGLTTYFVSDIVINYLIIFKNFDSQILILFFKASIVSLFFMLLTYVLGVNYIKNILKFRYA